MKKEKLLIKFPVIEYGFYTYEEFKTLMRLRYGVVEAIDIAMFKTTAILSLN